MAENDGIIIPLIADTSGLDAALQKTIDKLTAAGEISEEAAAKMQAAFAGAATSANQSVQGVNNLGDSFKKLSANITGGALKESAEAIGRLSGALRKQVENDEKGIMKTSIAFAKQTSGAIFQIEDERRNKIYGLTISRLEKAKDFELNNNNLTNAQKIAIQKKYDKEIAAQKLAQWKAEQKSKEEQALINGALSITNILATMPWTTFGATQAVSIAAAVASTAAQVAVIASQKPPQFAKGTPKGSPDAPYGMKLVGEEGPELIYTPGGERIIPSRETAKILAAYEVPHISAPTLNANELANIQHYNSTLSIDYHKLGNVLAEKLKSNPQTKIEMDKSGFASYLIERGGKRQTVNNRFST